MKKGTKATSEKRFPKPKFVKTPNNDTLKAFEDTYAPVPFYFKQKYDNGFRYVAWTPRVGQLKNLVYDIINNLSEKLEILLKVGFENVPDKFYRYYGNSTRDDLIFVMKQNELYIFSDGNHQLCVKDLDTEEYIALDDHDILFIYADSQKNIVSLKNNNFENREEKLILDSGHWHRRPTNSKELAKKLIKDLRLEKE